MSITEILITLEYYMENIQTEANSTLQTVFGDFAHWEVSR